MDFSSSSREREYQARVLEFMNDKVRPVAEDRAAELAQCNRWAPLQTIEALKLKAKAAGWWNLFLPPSATNAHVDNSFEFTGERLSNAEYALCAQEMGRIHWASEAFNCSAPDTGNIEVFHRYGTRTQKDAWLRPLMEGEIRSAFLMTEPDVASSDATNIQTSIRRDGNGYVIDGYKRWSSGARDPAARSQY